ncbi:MAG: hypothetical protein FWE56_03710 [Candidatus Bathyarchaeota archaeon]|nr:hypothetical protein [Candidatus Termiticorpusculum sp.]
MENGFCVLGHCSCDGDSTFCVMRSDAFYPENRHCVNHNQVKGVDKSKGRICGKKPVRKVRKPVKAVIIDDNPVSVAAYLAEYGDFVEGA